METYKEIKNRISNGNLFLTINQTIDELVGEDRPLLKASASLLNLINNTNVNLFSFLEYLHQRLDSKFQSTKKEPKYILARPFLYFLLIWSDPINGITMHAVERMSDEELERSKERFVSFLPSPYEIFHTYYKKNHMYKG